MSKLLMYMDNCCLNRPFDDQSQDKIRMEAESVLTIISRCGQGDWEYCKGDVLYDEIGRTKDIFKMEKVLSLCDAASVYIELSEQIINRAKEVIAGNIRPFDALHLASAEYIKADIFLTTDKKLINASKRIKINIHIANPAIWIMEVLYNE